MSDVYQGDCLSWLRDFRDTAQLVYIDPPYNTGNLWRHKDGSVAYDDNLKSDAEYVGWLRARLEACWSALQDDGSLWVHCDWHCDYLIRWTLEQICGKNAYRNQIVWCYTLPRTNKRHFRRNHQTIFFFGKPDAVFRAPRRPYHPDSLSRYNYPLKAPGQMENEMVSPHPDGMEIGDWWDDIHLRDATIYPTEKPIALLNRIITCSSDEGRLVLDPMAGSGVALEAAKRLNRRYAGCDINPQAVEMAQARLDAITVVQPTLAAT